MTEILANDYRSALDCITKLRVEDLPIRLTIGKTRIILDDKSFRAFTLGVLFASDEEWSRPGRK